MALHLIWPGTIPKTVSYVSLGIALFFQLLSFVLYAIRNNRLIRQYKKTDGEEAPPEETEEKREDPAG